MPTRRATDRAADKREGLRRGRGCIGNVVRQIEIEARALDVLAEPPPFIRLGDGAVHNADYMTVFAANVNVAKASADGERRNQNALNQLVGIVLHEQAVFARSRFTFVGVHHDVFRLRRLPRHEAPLHARGKACASPTAKIGRLHLLDDLFRRHLASLQECLVAVGGEIGVDGCRVRKPEAARQDLDLKGARFVVEHGPTAPPFSGDFR